MRKLLCLLLFGVYIHASEDIQQIYQEIIKYSRDAKLQGVDIANPFPKAPPKKEAQPSEPQEMNTTAPSAPKEPGSVLAIIRGSALIDGRWYDKGERYEGFEIVDIKENSVLLRNSESGEVKERFIFGDLKIGIIR